MSTQQAVREADRLETAAAPRTLDLAPLAGIWINTNPASRGIVRVEVTARDGGLAVRAWGAAAPSSQDWGEVWAESLYTDGIASGKGHGFIAAYDFGFMTSQLQANLSQGLLIVAAFNVFKDGSGRADYFSREFFHS